MRRQKQLPMIELSVIVPFLTSITCQQCPADGVLTGDFMQQFSTTNFVRVGPCGIHDIDQDAFVDSNSIVSFQLHGNDLTVIPDAAFSNLRSIDTLSLINNKLSYISNESFSGLQNLESLYLNRNDISNIPDGAFCELSKIYHIDMSENKMSHISREAFNGVKTLKSLFLISNGVSYISDGAFSGLRNLRYLRLDHNNLHTITQGMFTGIRINQLALNDNKITYIEEDSLKPITDVIRQSEFGALCLHNNELQTLPIDLQVFMSETSDLDVTLVNNPLHCNCELNQIRDWKVYNYRGHCYSAYPITSQYTHRVRCATPLATEALESLSNVSLNCIEPTTPTILVNWKDIVLTFHCMSTGDPAPRIIWRTPDGNIAEFEPPRNRTHYINTAVMKIHRSELLTGDYVCNATNIAGTKESRLNMQQFPTVVKELSPSTAATQMESITAKSERQSTVTASDSPLTVVSSLPDVHITNPNNNISSNVYLQTTQEVTKGNISETLHYAIPLTVAGLIILIIIIAIVVLVIKRRRRNTKEQSTNLAIQYSKNEI